VRLAEVALDRLLSPPPGDRGRDGGGEDPRGDALVRRRHGALADRMEPGSEVADDVFPEVGDHGDEGSEMERDVKGLVEARVRFEVVPVRDPRDEDQVSRG